ATFALRRISCQNQYVVLDGQLERLKTDIDAICFTGAHFSLPIGGTPRKCRPRFVKVKAKVKTPAFFTRINRLIIRYCSGLPTRGQPAGRQLKGLSFCLYP